MIIGLGIDIVKIERIEKILDRWNNRFKSRIFTEDEISYCSSKARPAQHYAARFAVKEAAVKMLGGTVYSWQDFEVSNDDSGKPGLSLKGETAEIALENGIKNLYVSIAHENDYAIAQVIGEGDS
ncbi:holo-ACP synthase [Iocasia frigidifontis]|uniref:holo-ACP synthase n=1 Tax=Iocasia fonsfrigidae TaxID=2682810 RepID=UPI001E47CE66|nr:holo-ACP synthase [Iocasia fonsfrigidae]